MAVLSTSGMEANGHFALSLDKELLVCGFFARSKTKVRGISANFGKRTVRYGYYTLATENEKGWTGVFTPVNMGRDRFTYCLTSSKEIGERYLLTTPEMQEEDVYEFLMKNYKLPLKAEWMRVLIKLFLDERLVLKPRLTCRSEGDVCMPLNGQDVSIRDIICYDFSGLKEESFEKTVSHALATKQISISEKDIPPLEFQGMDEYFSHYGCHTVDNLNREINPLVELRPNVEHLALKEKSLFPQQAASVEGVLALMRNGVSYAVLNHGMGCGKTIEAASCIDAAMVSKWLKANPGKTLRDAYEREGIITYRAIIMAPGHLVAKWAQEVEAEIPYAHATVISQFSQLIELRESGRKAMGKEFFVISKDFCKLDTQLSPIPTQMKKKYISLDICKECKEEDGKLVYKRGTGQSAYCPSCFGKEFTPYSMDYLGKKKGLICPSCGELLLEYKNYDPESEDFEERLSASVLRPKHFAKSNTRNSACYHCGASLWGANAKPLVGAFQTLKDPKWYKVSHYANHRKKGTTTAFVLTGHEKDYYADCITTEGLKKSPMVYGPRKVAPAHYIKKYLKGYFDFCVLDEVHKYLGDSAQGVAAHVLSKASKFTIALTGTISNGTAESFYNLFWMLEPARMKKLGYGYSNGEMMRFCREYGCVETVYEANRDTVRTKNSNSRGKQLTPPRVKPGISPVLFGRLLMDRCLFLDISDLSKYLPKLKEKVELVELPDDIRGDYFHTLDVLKEESHGELGMAALSTMLLFGLSYPDKAYGRAPIMNPFRKDALVCNVRNHEEYSDVANLTPKEERLIELVNKEMEEGRNVFVYATFTGSEESNVTYRLQELIEKYCNLKGRVEIIQSTTPAASKREEYFHKRAAEGIKVFITNPMNVETGLDFCFKHNGTVYNYPTLIFYQVSYSLATIWQASRRAYRLNQREECRVYYLAYTGTLQAAAIEIMAKKQVATAAIQGHFSAEGLSSMAKGVDARTQLAQALSSGDMSSRDTLENMFDALEEMNGQCEEDAAYAGFRPSLTFYQLVGRDSETASVVTTGADSMFEDMFSMFNMEAFGTAFGVTAESTVPVENVATEVTAGEPVSVLDDFAMFMAGFGLGVEEKPSVSKPKEVVTKKKKAKETVGALAFSLFDFA